jgi:membrane-bound ClpP family serine protease
MFWIWAVLLLLVAAGLAVLEVFFPSAGILGFLATAAAVGAVVMAYYEGPAVGTVFLIGTPIGLVALLMLAFKYWPKTAMGRRVLLTAQKGDDVLPDDPEKQGLKSLVGRTGRAKSKLLLSGAVTVDGRTIDAVSESMPIEVGQAVRVVQVRGMRVVVRPIDQDQENDERPIDPLQRTYDDPFELPPA